MATKLLVTVPDPDAPLLLYVATFDHASSGVLIQEKEEESKVIQQPVYYISEALQEAKLNYIEIKKIAYIRSKAELCHLDLIKKVEALLPSTGDHSAIVVAAQRHIQQQRGLRKNREIGNIVVPV